jgi:hypothetical protein
MPLEVSHRGDDGITVPYPPIFDGIRNNHGFVDTRGRADLASQIAEGIESNALRDCLVKISQENAYFSLGCDLGHHAESDSPVAQRYVAGGYLQLAAINYAGATTNQFDEFGLALANALEPLSKRKFWVLDLVGTYVNFRLPGEPPTQAPSMSVWFYAKARDQRRAFSAREGMISSISTVLHDRSVVSTLDNSGSRQF